MHNRFIALAVFAWLSIGVSAAQTVRVAAATNIKPALDQIISTYVARTGQQVEAIYGSSGNLRRQIAQGAPFDLFLSADEETALALSREGLAENDGLVYVQGRLVIFAAGTGGFDPDGELRNLGSAIAAGRIKRFAIANPDLAPYGKAAEQTLRKAGLWEAIQPVLVTGENVAQAAQFATSGASQGGMFALSLALTAPVKAAGTYALVPAGAHAPINQRMVVLKRARPEARAFFAELRGDAAGATFARHGYTVPGR